MYPWLIRFAVTGLLLSSIPAAANAEQSIEQAIKQDRARIEGTWRIVTLVINGEAMTQDQTGKLTVVNRRDGSWSLHVDGKRAIGGASTIDPTRSPKTIDFDMVDDDGSVEQGLGIYELGEDSRMLCFAEAGNGRPTEFTSEPGSDHTLVKFERVAQQ